MTIREVARKAGVSLQTVSNVINRRFSEVSVETRERVLKTIEALGYQPNAGARGLRGRKTYSIAFLTVDPSDRFLADPFHTVTLSGMADALREQGYGLLVQALPTDEPAEAFDRLYRQRRFDGAVLHLSGTPAERKRCIARLAEGDCPLVLVEEQAAGPRIACVRADNRQGARVAVEHLSAKGHRRIGFLQAGRDWPAVEQRFAGYRDALRTLGLPGPFRHDIDAEDSELARRHTAALLQREPELTALLCANDVLAVGALQGAKDAGRRVPADLAIIGFDDFDFAKYVDPPLTTVALPGYAMGRRAAELLLTCCDGKGFAESDVVFPTSLLVRGTV